jgi:hypothetical protein
MNEFAPPDHDYRCSAFPRRTGTCQFSMASMLAIITAMLSGGETTRRLAMSGTWLLGGVEVGLSMRGEAIFFALGSAAGTACAIGSGLIWFRLNVRAASFLSRGIRGKCLLVLCGGLVGAGGGVLILGLLGWFFFTAPDDVYRLLTNPPP